MVHAAHASRCLWSQVGDASNLAIGEWQIARVYSVLGRAEPAAYHASRSLELCREHSLSDFLTGAAHEGVARAALVAGDRPAAAEHAAAARRLLAHLTDPEEIDLLRSDLDALGL